MTGPVYFDDALPIFAKFIQGKVEEATFKQAIFLRGPAGRLTCIVRPELCNSEDRKSLSDEAAEFLGRYADPDGFIVVTAEELFDDSLKDAEAVECYYINHPQFTGLLRLVDRRVVGTDWLLKPAPEAEGARRFVFASLKGGVGRSTALAVAAAHLAAKGRRVLAIDLDLEAPGIGYMLLDKTAMPKFGLLDYLVESSLGDLDDNFFADLIGPSWLGGGRGRVDIVPAIGERSKSFPANVLAKLARAYLPPGDGAGGNVSFSHQVRRLIDRLSGGNAYDYVLIDARAGLHETTAAPLIGLGANVLFFGIDQSQTYEGYELLFAHLATYMPPGEVGWRDRIYVVHAKASLGDSEDRFSSNMHNLLARYVWHDDTTVIEAEDVGDLADVFDMEWEDNSDVYSIDEAFDYNDGEILTILHDDRFRVSDLNKDRAVLAKDVYMASYSKFLSGLEAVAGEDIEDEAGTSER